METELRMNIKLWMKELGYLKSLGIKRMMASTGVDHTAVSLYGIIM